MRDGTFPKQEIHVVKNKHSSALNALASWYAKELLGTLSAQSPLEQPSKPLSTSEFLSTLVLLQEA